MLIYSIQIRILMLHRNKEDEESVDVIEDETTVIDDSFLACILWSDNNFWLEE